MNTNINSEKTACQDKTRGFFCDLDIFTLVILSFGYFISDKLAHLKIKVNTIGGSGIGDRGSGKMTNAQYLMPNAPCPIPDPQSPIPDPRSPTPKSDTNLRSLGVIDRYQLVWQYVPGNLLLLAFGDRYLRRKQLRRSLGYFHPVVDLWL